MYHRIRMFGEPPQPIDDPRPRRRIELTKIVLGFSQ
jgi:hypothetical protein